MRCDVLEGVEEEMTKFRFSHALPTMRLARRDWAMVSAPDKGRVMVPGDINCTAVEGKERAPVFRSG